MRLLLTGASGQLGAYLLREIRQQGEDVIAWSGSRTSSLFGVPLQTVDLTDGDAIVTSFRVANTTAVLHAAAMARIADCWRDPALADLVNVQATQLLAELAEESKARFVHVSTDLVFDGKVGRYREDHVPAPLSIYGQTKLAAETSALKCPGAAVVRSSLLYGPNLNDKPTFFDHLDASLRAGQPLDLFEDEWRTPLSLSAAARSLVALVRSEITGLIHLGGPERMSRLEMGERLAGYLHIGNPRIRAISRNEAPGPEPRPCDTSLDSSHWRRLFSDLAWPNYEAGFAEFGLI
jgi:dTDP-4-dehydrorhamnose reductase